MNFPPCESLNYSDITLMQYKGKVIFVPCTVLFTFMCVQKQEDLCLKVKSNHISVCKTKYNIDLCISGRRRPTDVHYLMTFSHQHFVFLPRS